MAGKFSNSTCVSGSSIPVSVSGTGATSEQTFTSQVDPTIQIVIAGIKPEKGETSCLHDHPRSLKVASSWYLVNLASKLMLNVVVVFLR